MKKIFTKEIEKRKIFEYCVFSILFHDKEKNEIRHIGTGFLVYKKGLFISAGHVFRGRLNSLDDFRTCFIINGAPHILNIIHIIFQSIHRDKQKPPEFKDYAIGQVDIKNTYYLKMKKERPVHMERLTSWGYEYKEKSSERSLGIDFANLNLNKIHLKEREYNCLKDTLCTSSNQTFNNCCSLRGIIERTNSGAPIIDKNRFVTGIIIGTAKGIQGKDSEHEFIIMCRSKYYIRKISYNTSFKFKIQNCTKVKYNHPIKK